jgi:hypothetical protein
MAVTNLISQVEQDSENEILDMIIKVVEQNPLTALKTLEAVDPSLKNSVLYNNNLQAQRAKIMDAIITSGDLDAAYEMAVDDFDDLCNYPMRNLENIKIRFSEMDCIADIYWQKDETGKALSIWEKKSEILEKKTVNLDSMNKNELKRYNEENFCEIAFNTDGWYQFYNDGFEKINPNRPLYTADNGNNGTKPGALRTQRTEVNETIFKVRNTLKSRDLLQKMQGSFQNQQPTQFSIVEDKPKVV